MSFPTRTRLSDVMASALLHELNENPRYDFVSHQASLGQARSLARAALAAHDDLLFGTPAPVQADADSGVANPAEGPLDQETSGGAGTTWGLGTAVGLWRVGDSGRLARDRD